MAVEHAMFTFHDLKVTSRDDRMTTKVLSSRPRITCGETNEAPMVCSLTADKLTIHDNTIYA